MEGTSSVVLKGQWRRNVYIIDLNAIPTNSFTFMKATVDDPCLWHKRFAHISSTTLNKLKRWNLVEGLPSIKFDQETLCDSCARCKHVRFSFKPKRVVSTKEPLELVHMDLCGPIKVRSRGGSKYVFVLVDDYSRENGVQHNLSAPRTPQQNGVVERMNRALEDMAHTMLLCSRLPRNFWAEGLDLGGTMLGPQSFKEDELSSDDNMPPVSKKWRYKDSHPMETILGSLNEGVRTHRKLNNFCSFYYFLSTIEPTNIREALAELDWIIEIQEELQQSLSGETPGFLDSQFQKHVYKLDKALYGLKQASRAWNDRLSKFLLESDLKGGSVDKTLFLKSEGSDLLVIQIYVDDIIFGSSHNRLCKYFLELMTSEFEMSMMGELKFFLELQIQQTSEGIMIHQQKYIKELLRKFGMENSHSMPTPMPTEKKLRLDEDDYASCSLDRKSTSGIATFVGPCIITWGSNKQNSVALSTAQAEYIAVGLIRAT
ncbi:uncharacterized protein LOC141632288 [Silene latifolia]|uniref:uncharacterized protein LOC141632288 n=1 Tax=Silene latifolia TaxID=37657 RepID=UPI003D78019B